MVRWKWIATLVFVACAADVRAQNWDGLLNRMGDHVSRKIEERAGATSDKVIDKTFDQAGDTVNCAAGDEECARRANAEGRGVADTPPGGGTTSAKCVATDVGCLKQAKAHGQKIEIVDEEEVDTLYCSSNDTKCLQRAQKLHKKVEITD